MHQSSFGSRALIACAISRSNQYRSDALAAASSFSVGVVMEQMLFFLLRCVITKRDELLVRGSK